jgi:hypothetical protein
VRGQRVTQLVRCQGHVHIVRTPSLLLRTPTRRETQIATACGSDDAAQRWLGWEEAHVCPEDSRATLIASPTEGKEFPNEPVLPHFWRLIAIDPRNLAVAGEVGITGIPDEPPQLGGWLAPAYRGRTRTASSPTLAEPSAGRALLDHYSREAAIFLMRGAHCHRQVDLDELPRVPELGDSQQG